jgi:hypothetical protein
MVCIRSFWKTFFISSSDNFFVSTLPLLT